MNERTRRVFILVPLLLTLGVVAIIGVVVIVQNQRQADRVAVADAVAQDYLADVATFRSGVATRIKAAGTEDPAALADVVDEAAAEPPRLPKAPPPGRRESTSYAEAERVEASLLRPYERLGRVLTRADGAEAFIKAARKVLALRASDYLGFGLIRSSAPVRGSLIPAFVKARDKFDAVEVPKGQEPVAETVHAAVQYVIDQATTLADRADAGQNYSFGYTEQFDKARVAIDDYATTVDGDVAEALAAVSEDS